MNTTIYYPLAHGGLEQFDAHDIAEISEDTRESDVAPESGEPYP